MSTISEHDDDPSARTAGWYPDPSGTGRVWSGGRPAIGAGSTTPSAPTPVIKNTVATIGLAVGVVGLALAFVLGPWASLAAVVCSGAALPRATTLASHGYAPVGRARAIAGVALGVVGVVVAIAVGSAGA
jgi:hypothetical protein